jgi:hypothetical protein
VRLCLGGSGDWIRTGLRRSDAREYVSRRFASIERLITVTTWYNGISDCICYNQNVLLRRHRLGLWITVVFPHVGRER